MNNVVNETAETKDIQDIQRILREVADRVEYMHKQYAWSDITAVVVESDMRVISALSLYLVDFVLKHVNTKTEADALRAIKQCIQRCKGYDDILITGTLLSDLKVEDTDVNYYNVCICLMILQKLWCILSAWFNTTVVDAVNAYLSLYTIPCAEDGTYKHMIMLMSWMLEMYRQNYGNKD